MVDTQQTLLDSEVWLLGLAPTSPSLGLLSTFGLAFKAAILKLAEHHNCGGQVGNTSEGQALFSLNKHRILYFFISFAGDSATTQSLRTILLEA